MNIKENIISTNDYVTKSNLPFCDYVINPYSGCTHACKYCYASFMKRFTGHTEEWGTYIDIKKCDKKINAKKLEGKAIFLSSVTDPYNAFESKYKLTRSILEQLVDVDCTLYISTKSNLITRDIDILKKFKNLQVAISINTLDEKFKADMDRASSISARLEALKKLNENGIYTVLFMSPIFPEITNFKEIVEKSKSFVNEYWFENLNLRGAYKSTIMDYINKSYPQYMQTYDKLYNKGNEKYWEDLEKEIIKYCDENKIKYTNAFYHKKLVDEKKAKMK